MNLFAITWFIAGGVLVAYLCWLVSDVRPRLMLGKARWSHRCMLVERAMMVWSAATFIIILIGSSHG